ncbi:MAG: ribosome biogenesis GTPase YlqF [Methylococcaceae bacterium]|nr:ribosome biogenesis GTPase YlqF [Methylococcaceae bacterium]
MNIQWYPGHMHKAGREIKESLAHADIAIEILDARIPFSSENPLLAKLRGIKPCIKILNKSDLADPDLTRQWQSYFDQEKGIKTLAVSMDQTDKIKQLSELCRKLLPEERNESRPIQALIMGIPNVGKSTTINILAGRMIAKTGDEPAVTKHQQRIDIGNNVVLLDTPGMLWPNLENKHSGYRLAATGAIKDTAISHEDVVDYTLEYLMLAYPELIKTRYQIDELPENPVELMKIIGKKRGCLRSGGIVELDKAAKIVLNEFRSGTLGRITLERPDMMVRELKELEVVRANKAEKKLARKQPKTGLLT